MEKVRPLKSDHSQPHLPPGEDDRDGWFEEESVTDDFMLAREQAGELSQHDF